MNNRSGLVAVIMTILVGVILIGTLLAPTIEGIQKTAGDEVTYTNSIGGSYKITDYSDSVLFERFSDGTIEINGEQITDEHTGYVVASDGICIYYAFGGRLYFTSQTAALNNLASTSTAHITVEYSNGVSKYTNVDTSATSGDVPYTWTYIYAVDGDLNTGYLTNTSYYVKSIDDVICTGYYSSGENDTGYIFKDGTLQIAEDYESSVTYDLTLVDGTTDIYRLSNFKIHVGEEEFAPYVCLVPSSVTGHATSGAEYTLYGVIVVIFIVVLFVVAVRSLISREGD